jgi:hypothetical protein
MKTLSMGTFSKEAQETKASEYPLCIFFSYKETVKIQNRQNTVKAIIFKGILFGVNWSISSVNLLCFAFMLCTLRPTKIGIAVHLNLDIKDSTS